MNLQDMLVIRKELVQVVAMLHPELAKELTAMEKVQAATERAAKIVGTQSEADQKLAAAKLTLATAQEKAAKIRTEAATEAARISGLREKLEEDSRKLKQAWDDLKEADALHVKMQREHAAKMLKETTTLEAEKVVVNTLRDTVAAHREALVAKERELDAKHRAAMKALA